MNKTALFAVIVSLCIAVPIAGLSIYLDNTSNPLEESPIKITITSFNLTGYFNPVGVVWNDMFNLTYANTGPVNVDNLTITFATNSTYEMDRKIGLFYSEPPQGYNGEFPMGTQYPLGAVNANETKEFIGCIWNSLGDTSKVHGYAFTATLKSNGTFLDQATIMIPALV